MASKSFHLEDAGIETKSLSLTPEDQNSESSLKQPEKELSQQSLKSMSKESDKQTIKKLNLQQKSFSAKQLRKSQDENYNNEIPSPKTAGNNIGKKAILRNRDINSISNPYTLSKPSQFKLNQEARTMAEEAKISPFSLSRVNNESLQDIEFKEEQNFSQYPASIDILLPPRKESHSKVSEDLETYGIQSHQDIVTGQQHQNEQGIQLQTQQEHANETQTQSRNHNYTQNTETRATRSTSNRIVFSHNVEAAYTKVFKIYLVWFLSYGVLLGFNFGVLPYFVVFLFAFLFEAYFIFEICREESQQYDPLHEKRKLNSSFQILSIIVLEILGLIKYIGVDFPLSIATIPVFLTTVFGCYLYNSGDRRNSNALDTILQTLLSLQILTICLKVDSVLKWSWQGAFWVSWATLVAIAFYCVGLFIMFLFFLCFEGSNTSRSYQLAGLVWILITFSGCVGVLFFLVSGFTEQLEYGDDKNKITNSLLGGLSHVLFLAGYTWLAKNKIKKFLRRMVRPDIQTEQETKPEMKFEKATEGLPSYIVRFTPSYFLTFDESLKIKDGLKLKNIKKKLNLMKFYQYRRFIPGKFLKGKERTDIDKRDHLQLVEEGIHEEIDGGSLKGTKNGAIKQVSPQIKKVLPHRITASETYTPKNMKSKPKHYDSEAKKKVETPREVLNTEEERNDKLCFSTNDLDFMQKMEISDFLSEVRTPLNLNKKLTSDKEEEKACIICFDKFPDAVVMSCGHGGICYECAIESWKKSQECFMCRAKIDKVLHIDTNKLGKFNMRKVLSATKLAKGDGHRDRENFPDAMYIARNHI